MNPYAELADFLLTHVRPETLLAFQVSEEQHDYLLEKEKSGKATAEELNIIDKFMQVERTMRLAKARQCVHQ